MLGEQTGTTVAEEISDDGEEMFGVCGVPPGEYGQAKLLRSSPLWLGLGSERRTVRR